MIQWIILTLILILLPTCSRALTAVVAEVVDGDTIKVVSARGMEVIRLYGVDTPERSQPFGKSATEFTKMLVYDKTVTLTQMDVDRYERPVAIVSIGNKTLQEQLVLSGYAWVYSKYCKAEVCDNWLRLQSISAGNRIGLWSDPAPVQPWEWRKARK